MYILQIYSLIDEKIDREDGPKVLEYILVGLSVKPDSQKIVENVCTYQILITCILVIPTRKRMF